MFHVQVENFQKDTFVDSFIGYWFIWICHHVELQNLISSDQGFFYEFSFFPFLLINKPLVPLIGWKPSEIHFLDGFISYWFIWICHHVELQNLISSDKGFFTSFFFLFYSLTHHLFHIKHRLITFRGFFFHTVVFQNLTGVS